MCLRLRLKIVLDIKIEWRDRSFLGYKPFNPRKDRRDRAMGVPPTPRPILTAKKPKLGFQILPYGIESRWCDREYEDGARRVFEIKVRLPKSRRLRSVKMLVNDQGIYSYTLRQASKQVIAVCALDLIHRLIVEPAFDEAEKVPVYLGWLFLQRNKDRVAPQPRILVPEAKAKLKEGVNAWSHIRHEFTPYDYEWETEKFSRDESKRYWLNLLAAEKQRKRSS
jgi:hypothetical protein